VASVEVTIFLRPVTLDRITRTRCSLSCGRTIAGVESPISAEELLTDDGMCCGKMRVWIPYFHTFRSLYNNRDDQSSDRSSVVRIQEYFRRFQTE